MKLKNVLVIICSILGLSFFGFGQNQPDCSKYKTGKFEINNEDGTISYIERTSKFQSERTSDNGAIMKDKIIWLNECTYKLVPVKGKFKNPDMEETIGDAEMYFEIIETLEHAYIVRVTAPSLEIVVDVKVYESGYLNYDK